VYGEILFEAGLAVFWITSFAGMASYVQETSFLVGILNDYADTTSPYNDQSVPDLAKTSQTSYNCCIAITIIGAILL
jgi:hypothetical protein